MTGWKAKGNDKEFIIIPARKKKGNAIKK